MSKPEIVGLTVSVDISDKNYGSGAESFFSLQGKYPNPAQLDEVIVDGLEMYFAAWQSLMASRYATVAPTGTDAKPMTGGELKELFTATKSRLEKVRAFLERERVKEQSNG